MLATAGIAEATAPNKGWTYATSSASMVLVSFKVSKKGNKAIGVTAGVPVMCSGPSGGFPAPKPTSAKTKIFKKGTFKVVLKLFPLGGGKSDGTDTVTGKFLKGGKEKGTVKPHFNFTTPLCHTLKLSYTATGAP